MKKLLGVFLSFLFTLPLTGQVANPKFKKRIDFLLSETVPFISVSELKENSENYLILDAREKEEYEVSKIVSAKYVGYEKPDFSVLPQFVKRLLESVKTPPIVDSS